MTVSSNNPPLEARQQPELTPEEAALVVRIGVFVTMRWLAIAGVIIASLLTTQVLDISFSPLPVFIICAVMAAYNSVLFLQSRRLKAEASGRAPPKLERQPLRATPLVVKARTLGNIHIILDLLALTTLLHFTGGIENPFIFYFILHVTIAGILLQYRVVYMVATSAILLVLLLVGLEYNGIIPHVHLAGFASPGLYQQGSYLLGVIMALATCLYASAFMVNHISGELRKRQREVVALKDHSLFLKTRELEQDNKELARLEEGRQHLLRFLSMASHDLKAPLSAVQSYLQLMLGGFAGEVPEKQKHMLDRSSKRITELLELISDLLDISRIEGEQIIKEIEEVSLASVMESSIENVRALAKDKEISLNVAMPQPSPTLQASRVRLQQVLINLLSNAIKFTPEKGEIKLSVLDRNDDILVTVGDTGCGIAAEELPKLFTDFYRGGHTEKRGTGLGLSISKRIVEAHGGRIWAESPNPEDPSRKGSRFCFTLPKGYLAANTTQENKLAAGGN